MATVDPKSIFTDEELLQQAREVQRSAGLELYRIDLRGAPAQDQYRAQQQAAFDNATAEVKRLESKLAKK